MQAGSLRILFPLFGNRSLFVIQTSVIGRTDLDVSFGAKIEIIAIPAKKGALVAFFHGALWKFRSTVIAKIGVKYNINTWRFRIRR